MDQVKCIVYSSDLEESSFIIKQKSNKDITCISCPDARSAVYLATGICAQNKKTVMVCVDSGNASRSAFSGMTEAFYRQLPVVLVTFGKKLDYTKELGDVVFSHFCVNDAEKINALLSQSKPMHIEVTTETYTIVKYQCEKLQKILCESLANNMYLYIGQGIKAVDLSYPCKVVFGGMPDCYEGTLANVLGASLAKRRVRYIGLVSESEVIHDLNTLGNINVNDLLFFIAVCRKKNDLLLHFAESLHFESVSVKNEDLDRQIMQSLIENKHKTFLMLYQED